MTLAIASVDIVRFRDAIGRSLGLQFDDSKLGYLSEVLERRVEATGLPLGFYLDRLGEGRDLQPRAVDEIRALAQELTVNETYFFRNVEQFQALVDLAIPRRMAARSAHRQLRILSAGCATGEEPYSIAMMIREHSLATGWDVSIRGADVDPSVLARAALGKYTSWALRDTPPDTRRRWFRATGRDLQLDPEIQTAVTFEERNLALENPDLWLPDVFDVVFFRNVMMYFSPEVAGALVARITSSLAPGGFLFLGHAETLRGLSQDFHLCHTHGTFYYQRKEGVPAVHPRPVELARTWPSSSPPVADGGFGDGWTETVRQSTERILALSQQGPAGPTGASSTALAARAEPDLGVAFELLGQERFGEALTLVGASEARGDRDPDVLLLRAVLLTHDAQLDEAQKVCGELLEIDSLNAGAHYVLALCREGAGDRQGARDQDQIAAYLDPGFAMPRLHLGLLARRAGDRDPARRELGQAMLLLQREDPARLLLFGGGFSREALISLCAAELSGLERRA